MVSDLLATPTDVLARVRSARRAVITAEVEVLELALVWADAHPDLDDEDAGRPSDPSDPVGPEDPGFDPHLPRVHWAAGAPFATAVGRSTAAGEALIRDALVLRHRLPKVWARVRAGEVEVWRARRIAQAAYGAPADVAAHLDATLADIAHRVGPLTLDRLLDEAMLRLHPDEREVEQLEALDARHATLHEGSINHTGVAEMTLRGDFKDLHDFDQALTRVAAALAAADDAAGRWPEPLDVRRSRAVGVLADPATALALLEARAAPAPSKRIRLVVHLSADALAGVDPVSRCETTGRAVLDQQVRDWCGRTDTHLTVTPVIDLADHTQSGAYEIRGRLRTRVDLIAGGCVFPFCSRPARACDHDHVVPHAAGGTSCECNLAPLCRRHHRLKTHAGWTYTPLEPGTWLWSEPHGQQFLRNGLGTVDVTPPDRRVDRPTGCRQPGPALTDTG